MSLGILALKVGMTQVFDEKGTAHPVTVLQAGPCPVLQVKTVEKDGYNAVQVGFLDKSRKRSTRAERGHVAADLSSKRREGIKQGGTADTLSAKADCEPQKHIREFRLTEAASVAVGAKLTVGEVFKEGQKVDVIGTTKGRGYSGTMKRWNFAGLPASHGAKKVHRSVGSTSSLASNRGAGHHPQPADRQHRRREQCGADPRLDPRTQQRPGDDPSDQQGEAQGPVTRLDSPV
jgi:large subunit ribosomal protein L3